MDIGIHDVTEITDCGIEKLISDDREFFISKLCVVDANKNYFNFKFFSDTANALIAKRDPAETVEVSKAKKSEVMDKVRAIIIRWHEREVTYHEAYDLILTEMLAAELEQK